MNDNQENNTSWLDRSIFTKITLNWETIIFTSILVLAVFTRFYDLESRVMSHDENSHVYYSWRLSRGEGYQHTPMTHGPLQFHMIAFSFFLFGDNDLTARIPAALCSIVTILFLWKYRRYLGRVGTLVAGILMLISPFMLYYGRYVRNEAYVALFGVVTIWAILRYFETGENRFLYWLTAATVLHFTAKETAFIYTAQAMLFLGFAFIANISKKTWSKPEYRRYFLTALTVAFALIAVVGGVNALSPEQPQVETPASEDDDAAIISPPNIITIIPIVLSGLSFLLALYFSFRGFTWKRLREDRAFSMMLLLFTLVLPHLAPIPVRLVGWNPTDYSMTGMLHTAVFLVPLALISIGVGLLWNSRLWLINAAIFYIPFTILYTTIFTNGQGFFTGLVGSLGYWLGQQGVERGSQPIYYYYLIQVPVYEYLPALGSLLALGIVALRKRSPLGTSQITSRIQRTNEGFESLEQPPFLSFLGFWILTSFIGYAFFGEKMPWLTVHISWPMILLAGWAVGRLIESVDWNAFKERRGMLTIALLLVFFISLARASGSIFSSNPPFQGKELAQLNATTTFISALITAIASGWGLAVLLKKWEFNQFWTIGGLTFFVLMGVLTARTGFQAAFLNYDNANEYLVYAHSAGGVKEALNQIEELSQRTTDGLDIVIAYDDETTYPYWWYLRNYRNQKFYGANPTRELRDAPVILVGDNNFDKIQPVVGQAYHQFDYIRIWWPNQDYYAIRWDNIESEYAREAEEGSSPMGIFGYLKGVWEHIKPFFTDAQIREAVWQIWYNRDFTIYAELTNKDMSLPNWSPSDRMRLYVRKDVAAQIWNYGVVPVLPEEIFADPYEGKGVDLLADKILGGDSSEIQFQTPRNVAVAPDGSLYVADTHNHRIQHLTPDGELLHIWGSFADSAVGEAPGGTFYEPWGVAVGPDGFVYVADTWNHRIQKFTSDGQFIAEWGYFGQAEDGFGVWGPRDVVVDSDGKVYVTDTGNKRVVIYDQDGNFINEFGSAGLLAGQFDEPVGLAIGTEGQIYVADTWNQRIQVFQPDQSGLSFSPINEWGIVGWYGQSLDNKPYLAVNSTGNLFVSDPEGYRILEFTSEGTFIRFWGDYGSGVEGFNWPTGLAFDQDDGVWVADAGNHRLLHFTLPAE